MAKVVSKGAQSQAVRRSERPRTAWLSVPFLVIAATVLVCCLTPGVARSQAPSSVSRIGIDMNVAGNGPRTRVGVETAREACIRVNQGQTRQIDVFVDEIPGDRGVSGFEFQMLFNPSLVTVTASNFSQLLDQANRSDLFVPPGADTTSSDGSYYTGLYDFGAEGIEPNGASEIGPGILVRITLTGQAGASVGDLVLQNVYVQDDLNQAVPVTAILQAKVAANTDCPADLDGDGFTDAAEGAIGTGALDPCGNNGWPADLQANNKLDIADFNSFLLPLRGDGSFNKIGHPVPDPQDANIARWNLQVDGTINVGDLNALNPGVDAATSRPPMFGGQPAFFTNGGVCPFPP